MKTPVVIDIGAQYVKTGFSDVRKNDPDVIFHSRDALKSVAPESDCSNIDHRVKSWTQCEIEEVANHALNVALKVQNNEHPLLYVEKPGLPPSSRRKLIEFAFEGLGVPAFHLASEPLLALYSVGLTSGIVLSSGHASSFVSTVHDGHRPPYGVFNLGFGGRDVTDFTRKLVSEKLGREVSVQEAVELKCQYGCVKPAVTAITNQGVSCDHLEDIGREIGEMLLSPKGSLLGFHEAVGKSVYLSDEEDAYEPVFFRNIMLCGGNTLFPGLKERLEQDIEVPSYLSCKVRVIAPPFRQQASWVGGSIAASLPTFKTFWITKEDYAEYGGNILYRKCLSY